MRTDGRTEKQETRTNMRLFSAIRTKNVSTMKRKKGESVGQRRRRK